MIIYLYVANPVQIYKKLPKGKLPKGNFYVLLTGNQAWRYQYWAERPNDNPTLIYGFLARQDINVEDIFQLTV